MKRKSSKELAVQVLDQAMDGAEELAQDYPAAADALTLLGTAVAGLGRGKSKWADEMEKALKARHLRGS